jgi:8-oxo-dGTP pyrophosphatase MutT (NUDIX family)
MPPQRIFGRRDRRRKYIVRPGSYAILTNAEGDVATIKIRSRYFLPGGGAEPGERSRQTLLREVREECGCAVRSIRRVGYAVEYVHAPGEGYFEKRCIFYIARIRGNEKRIVWLARDAALRKLTFASQRWAVRQVPAARAGTR